MKNLPKNIFLLPFDHRGSFERELFGITGRSPTQLESLEISRYKRIIFDGFRRAIELGVPRETSGILVDEEFGMSILEDAKGDGTLIACSVEKSGKEEFEFEYGILFKEHIFNISPDFVKVLVRYNPDGDAALNLRQSEKLNILSHFCVENGFRFMFELLVPPTPAQLARVNGDAKSYDRELRAALMVKAMRELQSRGVEPDIWKVEGLTTETNDKKIVAQAQSGKRDHVRLIVLGRGENLETIRGWLETAANTRGFVGFAIGRTVWEKSLNEFRNGKISSDAALENIAGRFKEFCDLWMNAETLLRT